MLSVAGASSSLLQLRPHSSKVWDIHLDTPIELEETLNYGCTVGTRCRGRDGEITHKLWFSANLLLLPVNTGEPLKEIEKSEKRASDQ